MHPFETAALAAVLIVGLICLAVIIVHRMTLSHAAANRATDGERALLLAQVARTDDATRARLDRLEANLKEQFNNHANELVRINNKIGR